MVSPCEDCSLNTPPVRSRGCASQPDIMFVGEAPGAEEVARGEPFAGKAGRLLRETLQALGFNLSRVYYTNAVLCRPPGNRDPRAGEVRACHGRLMQEIAEVQPRVIVAMGNHSTTSLLGSGKGITRRRGQCRKVGDIWVVPTLHPAGVLRVPGTYIDFVDDLALAQTILQGEDPIIDPPYRN
ncbi:MAG: uracil-DNA glycosylase, partial [Bacilli bacterium]